MVDSKMKFTQEDVQTMKGINAEVALFMCEQAEKRVTALLLSMRVLEYKTYIMLASNLAFLYALFGADKHYWFYLLPLALNLGALFSCIAGLFFGQGMGYVGFVPWLWKKGHITVNKQDEGEIYAATLFIYESRLNTVKSVLAKKARCYTAGLWCSLGLLTLVCAYISYRIGWQYIQS